MRRTTQSSLEPVQVRPSSRPESASVTCSCSPHRKPYSCHALSWPGPGKAPLSSDARTGQLRFYSPGWSNTYYCFRFACKNRSQSVTHESGPALITTNYCLLYATSEVLSGIRRCPSDVWCGSTWIWQYNRSLAFSQGINPCQHWECE